MFQKIMNWAKVVFDWMKTKKLITAVIAVSAYLVLRYAGVVPDWIPTPLKDIFKQLTNAVRLLYLKAISDVAYMALTLVVGAIMAGIGYVGYKKIKKKKTTNNS